MLQRTPGKLNAAEERIARLLGWIPWLSLVLVMLPAPIVFLMLFLAAGTTDSAAIYFLLSFVSMGLGLVVGVLVLISLFLYRRRWYRRLRDRLASDGITASEVPWFASELSSEERKTWGELKLKNPLLADAYCETLATRLTASRIIARARGETLKIERQINRTRNIRGADTSALLNDLIADRQRSQELQSKRPRTAVLVRKKPTPCCVVWRLRRNTFPWPWRWRVWNRRRCLRWDKLNSTSPKKTPATLRRRPEQF